MPVAVPVAVRRVRGPACVAVRRVRGLACVAVRRGLACLAVVAAGGLATACSSGSTEAFCDEAAAVAADNPAAIFAAWDPANPATTEQLARATEQLHELADTAPPEIADDAGLIASTADDLSELLTDLQGAELDAALRQREGQFAAVDEASGRVTDFTRTECGVDFTAPAPSTTTTVELP
jgi:hypothetical protein